MTLPERLRELPDDALNRLAELLPYVRELFWKGEPLVISALGRGGAQRA